MVFRRYFLFFSWFVLNILAEPLLAQIGPVASVSGRITGPDQRAIPGVHVYLRGTAYGTASDSSGHYQLTSIQPGRYELIVQGLNYQLISRSITLAVGQRLLVDHPLTPSFQQLDEVTVRGQSQADALRQSAKAVDLIETKEVKLKSVDLGEVLAQAKGVNVRRSGGLGSDARFSLNGLSDDQVRFFMDDVPLAFSGYSFGFANVPVNLVERIEIYKGVVPIRFGADALGGAVNIVTPMSSQGMHGAASYQMGSFGTHRLALSGQYTDKTTGLFTRVAGFYDYARNNYKVNIQTADDRGRLQDATVRRFHDAYEAKGVNAEIGLKNKSWAQQLSLKLFSSAFVKEMQNNNVMTIPYGEVVYGEQTKGVSARYKQRFGDHLGLDYSLGYASSETRFSDVSPFVYDWYGSQVAKRGQPGEINVATDQLLWDKSSYARLNGEYILREGKVLRLSSAPTYVTRTGDELRQINPGGRDPLTARRNLLTWVNGLEYETNSATERFQYFGFAKHYFQQQNAEEPLPGGEFRQRDRHSTYYGLGNSLRYNLSDRLRLKASYEWATRLPNPDEIFGDGALTLSNLTLQPERSHNGNLEVSLVNAALAKAKWNLTLNGFIRSAQNLIVLLGTDKLFGYQNVFSANSLGVEVSAGWVTLNNRLSVAGNATWQDFRNASSNGSFTLYHGDRIPNTPYQMANGSVSYCLPQLFRQTDELSFFWDARYVYQFYRGWESAGLREFKQIVPTQFVNNVGFTYKLPTGEWTNTLTGEMQNLTDANVYDNFGVQRPGRAFYIKLTTQF